MSTSFYETLVQEDIDVGVGTASKRSPAGGSHTGTQVGVHSIGVGQASTSTEWDTNSIAAGSAATKEVTVSGAALGDFVLASLSLDIQDMMLDAQVTATNTVTAVLYNRTSAAIDILSPTLKVLVLKSR